MNLKKWIISSYIVVMLLPLIAGASLYLWINSYNQNNGINDYLSSCNKLNDYAQKLNNPELYSYFHKNYNLINKKASSNTRIILYDKNGLTLYDTCNGMTNIIASKNQLYSNLYNIIHEYNYDMLKQPVFKDNVVVGFFQIEIARSNWVNTVNYRQNIAITIFIVIFILVLFSAIIIINRKLNRPIYYLMNRMSDFANGKADTPAMIIKNNEIGTLINHFEVMKKELQRQREEIKHQEKAKEYMVAAISHDLKTPLTSIRAYAETLSTFKDLKYDDVLKYSSIIVNKSDAMYSMLDDLLMYSTLTDEFKISPVEVEGDELFEMLFSGYDEVCQKHNIHLNTFILSQSNYKIDVKYMTRVIDNLVSNAIRYTNDTGEITLCAVSSEFAASDKLPVSLQEELLGFNKNFLGILQAANTEHNTLVLVKNTGTQISDDDMEKVFEPFYQVDDSRNKSKKSGIGLGLNIVKKIVDKHDGKMIIQSGENFGTIIGFTLREIQGDDF